MAHAVLGIGLNVNLPGASLGPFPDGTLPPTSVLDLTGRPASREALLLHLLRGLGRLLQDLYAGRASDLLARYRSQQVLLGQPVRLMAAAPCPERPWKGSPRGSPRTGPSLLRLPGGERRAFAYGEVTLRPTTPPPPPATASITRCASQPSLNVGVSGRETPSSSRGRMCPS